jgi:hypothetical protein
MEQVLFGRWRLQCDREGTREAFARIEIGGPEACGCCHCRNFAAARSQVYPAEVLSLFEGLGIDSRKEREVYHLTPLESGLHLYGGWFHFVGRIEEEGKELGKFDMESTGPFKLFFHEKPALVPESFEGLPLVQLEFEAQVPWVIEEHEAE